MRICGNLKFLLWVKFSTVDICTLPYWSVLIQDSFFVYAVLGYGMLQGESVVMRLKADFFPRVMVLERHFRELRLLKPSLLYGFFLRDDRGSVLILLDVCIVTHCTKIRNELFHSYWMFQVQKWLNELCEELCERLLRDLEQNKRIARTLTLHASAYKVFSCFEFL